MEPDAARRVEGRTVVSGWMPAVRVEVAADFAFVGRLAFVLHDVARVESFVFAAADGGRAGRLLVVQFEGYLEENDLAYDYPCTETVVLGDRSFLADAAVVGLTPPPPADSDVGRVLSLLAGQGYALPARAVVHRFVHLPDKAKRRELLILYAEGLDDGDADAVLREEMAQAVRERALRSFTVRFLDDGETSA